jgi:protein-tyrosine phosphatase
MIKEIRFFNRDAAKAWIPCPDEALISIYGKDEESPIDKTKWTAVLPLQFDDADVLREDRLLFTKDQAKQILDFAESLEAMGVEHLFVHCKGGISRSAAVAIFLGEEYFGVKVYMGFRLCPPNYSQYNKFVYRMLHNTMYGPGILFE